MFCLNINTFFTVRATPAQVVPEGFRVFLLEDILGMVLGKQL